MTTPRAVLYLRLSVSKEESTSIAKQERLLRERAAKEGWPVVEVVADDGVSGAKNREGTDRVLDLVRQRKAEVVMVFKMDRWGRSGVSGLGRLFEVLEQTPGSRFIAVEDGLDSAGGPAWDLMAPILSILAKQERDAIRIRVRTSIAQLHRDRRYTGGNLPYGFTPTANPDGPGRVLVHNPDEVAIVREVADRVIDGESLYSVTHDLNARGVPTRRGRTWSIQALRQILTSDAILGRVKHDGDLIRDDDGLPVTVWEPVLPLETWSAVARALPPQVKRAGSERAPRTDRLLSGIPRCGLCTKPLYLKLNGSGTASYACTQRSNGRTCPGVSVAADAIEGYVEGLFLDLYGAAYVHDLVEVRDDDAEASEVSRALDQTAALYGRTRDREQRAHYADRMDKLSARLDELESAARGPEVIVAPTGQTAAERWADSNTAGRRQMLAANIAVLTVAKGRRGPNSFDPSRVTILWQPAFPAEHSAALARPVAGRVVAVEAGN